MVCFTMSHATELETNKITLEIIQLQLSFQDVNSASLKVLRGNKL